MEKFKYDMLQSPEAIEFLKWINTQYEQGWEYHETIRKTNMNNSNGKYSYTDYICLFKRI